MTDSWPRATITSFEQVPVASTVTLLRVTADAATEIDPAETRPVLVATVGDTLTRYAPIPAPPDTETVLRAAYSVTEEVVATAQTFFLECGDGSTVEMPPPVIGARRTHARTPPSSTGGDEEDRRSALAPKLAELTNALAQARHEAGAASADSQSQLMRLHIEAAELRAELAAQCDLARWAHAEGHAAARTNAEAESSMSGERMTELEIWSGELERRLAETTTQLSEAQAAAEQDGAELRRLRDELAEAESRLELGRAEIDALSDHGSAASSDAPQPEAERSSD